MTVVICPNVLKGENNSKGLNSLNKTRVKESLSCPEISLV